MSLVSPEIRQNIARLQEKVKTYEEQGLLKPEEAKTAREMLGAMHSVEALEALKMYRSEVIQRLFAQDTRALSGES